MYTKEETLMKRNNSLIIIFSLCLAVMLTAMLGPGDVRADDVDVYKTTAKNTAMVVFDDSGSMSFPVYDASMDYANFMWWLHDQDLAVDNKTLGENLLGDRTHRTDFWG
jgi:hypothetical protein